MASDIVRSLDKYPELAEEKSRQVVNLFQRCQSAPKCRGEGGGVGRMSFYVLWLLAREVASGSVSWIVVSIIVSME